MAQNNITHEMRFTGGEAPLPHVGGVLTSKQLEDIKVWIHVPPFDGFILQLQGTGGVIGSVHSQVLTGFRGSILSEMIAIEYLLAAVPLADELKDEVDFNLKFWKKTNENKKMFGARIDKFKEWVGANYLEATSDNFDKAAELLLDVRNSLSHYPVQAAFNGSNNTLTPFVYRASKEQMFIFDEHKITVLGTFIDMVRRELQLQFDTLNAARKN